MSTPSLHTPTTPLATKPTALILLCCHAIYLPNQTSSSDWLTPPYATNDIPAFITHIKTALTLLSTNPSSVLILSGGPTHISTPVTEAASYLNYITTNLDPSPYLLSRIHLEEQALDSYHNVLFSLLLFWKLTHTWPLKVTIVSHEFKRARFLDLHAPALKLGGKVKMDYVGIDPEYMAMDQSRGDKVRKGEWGNGYALWERDLHGRGVVLRGKRKGRNWWGVSQLWFEDDVEGNRERRECGVESETVEWVNEEGNMIKEETVREGVVQPWE